MYSFLGAMVVFEVLILFLNRMDKAIMNFIFMVWNLKEEKLVFDELVSGQKRDCSIVIMGRNLV